MPLHQSLSPSIATKSEDSNSTGCCLSATSFGAGHLRAQDHASGSGVRSRGLDEVGPHVGVLRALVRESEPHVPQTSSLLPSADEKRLEVIEARRRVQARQKGREEYLPTGAHVIDFSEVLAERREAAPMRDLKDFLDRAGLKAGETSYLRFPDGSISAVRRRVLDNKAPSDEVVWVETRAAVGYLHGLEFVDGKACVREPVSFDIRGFFDPVTRISVVPMIEKRNGRSFSEWREESLVTLETAVHELRHGRGGGEYQARTAGDAYLHRNRVTATPGDPLHRLDWIAKGWYTAAEYSAAVRDAMKECNASHLVVPARLPDYRFESLSVPMILGSVAVATFSSVDAMQRGDGADLSSYGLTAERLKRVGERRIVVYHEGFSARSYRWLGEPLVDRIMEEASISKHMNLRILVGQAISHRIANECIRLAPLLETENPTTSRMQLLGEWIGRNFRPGDVHLAMRDYVASMGGAAVVEHGDETVWVNSLPQGVALRRKDSVTLYLCSDLHRGAALRIPLSKSCPYEVVAQRVLAFEGDAALIESLHERRWEESRWVERPVPEVRRGARYLFPAPS